MDPQRREQLRLLKEISPSKKFEIIFELRALALSIREARVKRQNPGASKEQLREILFREVMKIAPDSPLPAQQ